MAEPRRQPSLPVHLIQAITDEVIREPVAATRAGEDRLRWIEIIDPRTLVSEVAEVGVERVTLVAEHHQASTRRATERVEVLIAAAPEAAGVEIGLLDDNMHSAPSPFRRRDAMPPPCSSG